MGNDEYIPFNPGERQPGKKERTKERGNRINKKLYRLSLSL